MMLTTSEKRNFLQQIGADSQVVDNVLAYCENKFQRQDFNVNSADERITPSIVTWKAYLKEAKEFGVYTTLQRYFVQLQFPILKGISATSRYRNATLKGVFLEKEKSFKGLVMQNPEGFHLEIHHSLALQIPVITVANPADFKTLVHALAHKNEPVFLPDSMGAVFLKGLNNWNRILRLKTEWKTKNEFGSWNKEFKENILPNKALYQDDLIILSKKPYSNIAATNVGLAKSKWLEYSTQIRLHHECAHLFTLQKYGSISKNLHDELIADYAGITAVLNAYNAAWFLHFMGLEKYPTYRKGGRLENYVDFDISEKSFRVVTEILVKATRNLLLFDTQLGRITSSQDQLQRMQCLCETDLI